MITVLAGGVGAARFLRGLVRVVDPRSVTVVVNVGDDLDHLGVRVCPDLDSITYHLAGVVHPDQQWGRADETHVVADELARYHGDPWFTLGDRDLALCLERTRRLAAGEGLTAATAAITAAWGLGPRLLPVTEDRARTRITTRGGDVLTFQEYWVRDRAAPAVASVDLVGASTAGPGVVAAIRDADVVLLAPSNPVVSIGTVLAVPGVREALATTTAPRVGVSPIVGGNVLRGMADRLLPAIGVAVDAVAVGAHYAGLLDGWVMDVVDADRDPTPLVAARITPRWTDTLLDDVAVAARCARTALDLAAALRAGR